MKSSTVRQSLLRTSQAAAELLEEDGRALGRPEEEDGVDLRHVDAFVEEVDGEETLTVPARSVAQRAARDRRWSVSADTAIEGRPASVNSLRHELGVRDAHAEAERAHRRRVGDACPATAARISATRASSPV